MRECVCARACVCVRACVRACVRDVFAIYDNTILPRLIMIIIKIIFLYCIEIAHNDDFPSTGTRLVIIIMHFFRAIFLTSQVIQRHTPTHVKKN